jgi:hypothetical protein
MHPPMPLFTCQHSRRPENLTRPPPRPPASRKFWIARQFVSWQVPKLSFKEQNNKKTQEKKICTHYLPPEAFSIKLAVRRCAVFPERFHPTGIRDRCYDFLKYFRRKIWRDFLVLRVLLVFAKNDHSFEKNADFFAENCDHNLDPSDTFLYIFI